MLWEDNTQAPRLRGRTCMPIVDSIYSFCHLISRRTRLFLGSTSKTGLLVELENEKINSGMKNENINRDSTLSGESRDQQIDDRVRPCANRAAWKVHCVETSISLPHARSNRIQAQRDGLPSRGSRSRVQRIRKIQKIIKNNKVATFVTSHR